MKTTISVEDMEEALRMWDYGAWARTAWPRALKPPPWVRHIKTLDREKELRRYFRPISDDYGEKLDSMISKLPDAQRDILINIYVNLLSLKEAIEDAESTYHVVSSERRGALQMMYGALVFFSD